MKKNLMVVMLLSTLLLVGCGLFSSSEETALEESTVEEIQEVVAQEEPEEVVEEATPVMCKKRKDCATNERCLDGECVLLAEAFSVEECSSTCTIQGVTIDTSDDETYELHLGEGSYSYAGALEWRLPSIPGYCEENVPAIPIELSKRSTGEILERQTITLALGETSEEITHPTIERVRFRATLSEIDATCS